MKELYTLMRDLENRKMHGAPLWNTIKKMDKQYLNLRTEFVTLRAYLKQRGLYE
jgi:hypothetical protein